MRSKKSIPPRPWTSLYLFGLLAVVFMLAACGGSSNTPTAQQLITNARSAIQKVKSYHINLAVDNPGNNGTLTITSADGDILVPDKFKATTKVLVFGSIAQVQYIAIGANEYITDPVSGKWGTASNLLDPRTLTDPQTGVAGILGHIQNPSTPSDSNVDGRSCWSINGTLDAKYLAAIIGGSSAPAGSMVAVTTCIGKSDNLPYLMRFTGVAAQGDLNKTARTFKLSKFNESLTITAPI